MCPQDASAFIAPGNPYRPPQVTEGVYRDEATNSDLFFITLEKSEREYSPSTLYMRSARSPEEIGDSPHFSPACRVSGTVSREMGTVPISS